MRATWSLFTIPKYLVLPVRVYIQNVFFLKKVFQDFRANIMREICEAILCWPSNLIKRIQANREAIKHK